MKILSSIFMIFLLITIYAFFFLFLKYPQLEGLFALYANGSLLFVFGMVGTKEGWITRRQKYGNCGRKDKSTFLKPWDTRRELYGDGYKISMKELGRLISAGMGPSPRKGLTWEEYYGEERAKEIKEKLSFTVYLLWLNINSTYNTREFRRKLSESAVRRWLEFQRCEAAEFYGLNMKEPFFPGSLRDHKFARLVLIEKVEFWPFIECNGLREHPSYMDKEGKRKVIPVPLVKP